jgi:alanine racemase
VLLYRTVLTKELRPILAGLYRGRRLTVPVHVKVDTGMGRLGVAVEDAVVLLRTVGKLPGLALEGIYTHYAAAEDDAIFSKEQARRFQQLLAELKASGIQAPLIHANNSAALLHEPDTIFNLVRPGLLVYGILPQGKRSAPPTLQKHFQPTLSWKCRVSLVKDVARGASLSYGRSFIAPQPLRVATLTAGYGDGYLRAASGRAEVLVQGRRCRLLGRVTMDQMMVDVSQVKEVSPGDEAVLIGRQGKETISATDLAGWFGTIPWEVLTAITYRVPRIYQGSQAA